MLHQHFFAIAFIKALYYVINFDCSFSILILKSYEVIPFIYFPLQGKSVAGQLGIGKVDSRLLRLRGIGPEQQGLYTCVASNAEGDGQSNAVNINIECE